MTCGQARVLVLGRAGQVASALALADWPAGVAVEVRGRARLDLRDHERVRSAVETNGYAAVVNAAAYTQVDRAEDEADAAYALNRDSTAVLAAACASRGIPLIHLSTDYVFDGAKADGYAETDAVRPLGVYGASKAASETALRERLAEHVIVRTAWVFSATGQNFLKTMLRLGAEREELRIVDDQHGCPTAAADIARAIVEIVAALLEGKADGYGTFHFCSARRTTWYDFASEIFRQAAGYGSPVPARVTPIPTSEYPTPVTRPMSSVLDCTKIARVYGIEQPCWQRSLADCLDALLEGRREANGPAIGQ